MELTGRVSQHVRSFIKALRAYDPQLPLSRFLNGYFKANRQMGSKDRKMVTRYLYHCFRVGNSMANQPNALHKLQQLTEEELIERLLIGEFLCADESALVEQLDAGLAEQITFPLEEKIICVKNRFKFQLDTIFPWVDLLSEKISAPNFNLQFLLQPFLYLRARKSQLNRVISILNRNDIRFGIQGDTLILPNGTNTEAIGELKGLVEVQDLSSQHSLDDVEANKGEKWWDACSGAGGKSLLLMDKFPYLQLTVSDVRPSILTNLKERFTAAGIKNYNALVVNLEQGSPAELKGVQFDGIILDVPCSGSGTWGRTPEMLSVFENNDVKRFASLQKRIAEQVIPHLKPEKCLYYITCSVFQAENEDVVEYLVNEFGLEIINLRYQTGYTDRADTLFVCKLRKPAQKA
jgi:16S rRNA (cytosine967-C5)-methyltransferase